MTAMESTIETVARDSFSRSGSASTGEDSRTSRRVNTLVPLLARVRQNKEESGGMRIALDAEISSRTGSVRSSLNKSRF